MTMPTHSFQKLGAEKALAWIFSAYEQDRAYSLFDTRDADSYARGHLPGAEHLVERDIGEWIGRLPRTRPVLVYCYHGNASQQIAKTFADFGFAEVYSIDGGFHALTHAWQHARAAMQAAEAARPAPSTALLSFMANEGYTSADINATTAHDMTPLMKAARAARPDLVEELLALGAGIEARNSDGNTALWLACFGNDARIVQRLIAAGARLDHRNDNGATALMYCASSGRDGLVRLLLDAGADPDLRTLDDFRAVDLASSLECLRLLRHTA
jgi:rhodanese-related sulfurtransferase